MRSLNEENYLGTIRKYFAKNYNPVDRKKPRGICSRCRNQVLQIQRDDADPKKTADPSILDDPVNWDSLYFPTITRSSGVTDLDDLRNCDCDICLIARGNVGVAGNTSGTGHWYWEGEFQLTKIANVAAMLVVFCTHVGIILAQF